MKDPNAMTVDECRDELARSAGYKPCPNPSQQWHFHGFATRDHPIPATLDEAAKLPDGWWYWINYCSINKRDIYHAMAARKSQRVEIDCNGTTELEARFRLRVAVERIAVKEKP